MKILVPYKRVPDADQKLHLLDNSKDIDHEHLSYVVNPFDAIALEEALRIRETSHEQIEIVAATAGPSEAEKELRTALALGADRAMHVVCDQPLDPWNVSSILLAITRSECPDLILMGKQAVDDDANQTGQFLAARLNWPQATFASQVELTAQSARVARETDGGMEEILVAIPAVITADLRLNEPRYASLPSIMKARKKPIETVSLESLGVCIEPRVHVIKMETVTSQRSCVSVGDVGELIRCLREEVKVL